MVLTAPPMAQRFVDQSWGKLTPHQIKEMGFQGSMGYVSDTPAKNMTKAHAQECLELGLEVYIVWQEGKQEPLGGAPRGHYAAEKARTQMRGLGLADTTPIRFAADFPPTPTDRKKVEEYYLAAEEHDQQRAQHTGLTRAYGADYVLNWLVLVGIPGDWQCAAWSGATNLDGHTYNGRISPAAAALQQPQVLTKHGVWIDHNWLLPGHTFPGARSSAQPAAPGDPPTKTRPKVVGVATTPTGNGYWEVADDGGVFNYGDAKFHGSLGGIPLHKPVCKIVATPTGNGYWLIATDGGVFAFGDAAFFGSLGGVPLAAPISSAATTPTGRGLRLVGRDGGIFCLGDATYHGSINSHLEQVYGPLT